MRWSSETIHTDNKKILNYIKSNPGCDIHAIMTDLNITEQMAKNHTHKLSTLGLIDVEEIMIKGMGYFKTYS